MFKSIVLALAVLAGMAGASYATDCHAERVLQLNTGYTYAVPAQLVVAYDVNRFVQRLHRQKAEQLNQPQYYVAQPQAQLEKVRVERVRQNRLRNVLRALTAPRQKVVVKEQVQQLQNNHY